LPRDRRVEAELERERCAHVLHVAAEPRDERISVGEGVSYVTAQPRHRERELSRARGRLAEPKWQVRRLALGIDHPDLARLDADDLPRVCPELEDVACRALDREVLVERADARALRL